MRRETRQWSLGFSPLAARIFSNDVPAPSGENLDDHWRVSLRMTDHVAPAPVGEARGERARQFDEPITLAGDRVRIQIAKLEFEGRAAAQVCHVIEIVDRVGHETIPATRHTVPDRTDAELLSNLLVRRHDPHRAVHPGRDGPLSER